MIPFLILGAATIIGFGVIAEFFKKILNSLKTMAHKVVEVIKGQIIGTKVALQNNSGMYVEKAKYYSKEADKFKETIMVKHISVQDIPSEYLQKFQGNSELDITNDLELQLSH